MPEFLQQVCLQPGVHALPMLLTAVATVALGVAVLVQEKASRESLAFFLLTAAVTVWMGTMAGLYAAPDERTALWWARAGFAGVPLIPAAMYDFVTQLLRIRERRRRVVWAGWTVGALFLVAAFATDWLIAGVRRFSWGYYGRYGWLGAPFLVFLCLTLALALGELWRRHRAMEPGAERSRTRWLLTAFAIGSVAVVDFLAVFGFAVYPIGYAAVLTALAIGAAAIRRYRLVDLTPSFAAEQILATMADALIVVDARRCIRIVNEAARAVLGTPAEALIGAPLESLAPPGSAEAEALRELCATPSVRDREMLLPTAAGSGVEVSVSSSPLRDAQGAAVGTVLIARDIQERKRAERALRDSETRFRSLIENISDAILLLDAEGVLRYASSSLSRVIGYSPEERVGRSALELIHPDDLPGARRLLGEGGPQAGLTVQREVRLRHRDGSWRIIDATATNLLHDPAVGGIIITYHDATHRRQAEAALRERDEQLRHSQKMEALGRLAGGVAHDFNNLLTVITGQARLLLDEGSTEEEVRTGLEEILRAGERAGDVTRQLLAVSRRQVMQPRVLDLNAVLDEMERILRRLIGEDVRLSVTPDPVLARVRADPGQLEQVVLNLAVNARDAMPLGGVLSIRSRNAFLDPPAAAREGVDPGSYVVLTVSDTGEGIAPDVLPHIFDPFYTTKEQGKGTGLGLSTVYGIVKQSRGFMRVESEPGRGTTFEVFLPRVAERGDTDPRSLLGGERRTGRETVLLVEDDRAVRSLARLVLQRSGYTVLEAESAQAALRLCEEHGRPIDLLLTDVVMPEMGGRELAERLEGRHPMMKVLYMSGYTDDTIVRHGVLNEGIPFLEKPFTPAGLTGKVREVLEEGVGA